MAGSCALAVQLGAVSQSAPPPAAAAAWASPWAEAPPPDVPPPSLAVLPPEPPELELPDPPAVCSTCPCPVLAQILAILSSLAAWEQSTLAVCPAPATPTPVTSEEVGVPVEVAVERERTSAEPPCAAEAMDCARAEAWVRARVRRAAAAGGGGAGRGGGGGWGQQLVSVVPTTARRARGREPATNLAAQPLGSPASSPRVQLVHRAPTHPHCWSHAIASMPPAAGEAAESCDLGLTTADATRLPPAPQRSPRPPPASNWLLSTAPPTFRRARQQQDDGEGRGGGRQGAPERRHRVDVGLGCE